LYTRIFIAIQMAFDEQAAPNQSPG